MLLHYGLDASAEGYKIAILRAVDTDVVVLSIAFVSKVDVDSFFNSFLSW